MNFDEHLQSGDPGQSDAIDCAYCDEEIREDGPDRWVHRFNGTEYAADIFGGHHAEPVDA